MTAVELKTEIAELVRLVEDAASGTQAIADNRNQLSTIRGQWDKVDAELDAWSSQLEDRLW